jgi:hypothetical protein
MKFNKLLLVLISAALTACGGGGGGGGGGGTVSSTNTFNLQSGYVALASTGWNKTFTVTGTCSGSIAVTQGAATTATNFESAAALSGNSVVTTTFSNCNPPSSASTETRYYDSNYIPKGYSVQGGNYAVYASAPTLPTSVRVGDVGVIGTLNLYTNSTKSTSAGHQDESYVIEADTATTAIVNVISKYYNAAGTLTSTEQDRYRMAADGSLTAISLDIQYANGSTTHLIGN